MNHQHSPKQNRLLASLSAQELQILLPHLHAKHFKAGQHLAEAGGLASHIYFPVDSAIALFYRLEGGESAGVTVIGNEGMFNIAHALNNRALPYCAEIETPGHMFMVEAEVFSGLLRGLPGLRAALLAYGQASLTQVAQSVVCGKHHTLMQQVCQHLLLINDKSLSDDFRLTHEMISNMLGVRRESITEVAGELRDRNIIDYSRGHIKVLDRAGLERSCCECYGVVREEYARLLGV